MQKRLLAVSIVLALSACGKGKPGAPPDAGTTTCTTLQDCAGGQVCLNSRCIPICHSTADCAAGQVCEEGICLAPACGNDQQCATGQACINGACTTAISAAQVTACDITPNPAVVRASSSTRLSVIARDATGHALHFAGFSWSVTAGPATADQTGLVSASAAGDITVNASGGTATCNATVHAYAAVPSTSLRVLVINMHTKEPVAGAKVVLGSTSFSVATTGADGTATFDNVGSSLATDVHVFATGYNYTSFLQAGGDLLVPITPYVNPISRRSGFQGHMCESRSSDAACPAEGEFAPLSTKGEAVHLAFFGSSIPNSLLDLSVDTLVGPLHPVTVTLGGNTKTLNLPQGLVLGAGSNLFGTQDYRVFAAGGKRAAWGLGGNVSLTSALSALGPILQGGSTNVDIGSILPQLLPLFGKLQAGAVVDIQADAPAATGNGTFKPIAVPLNTALRLRAQPVSPTLPMLDGQYLDGVIAVAGALDYPLGFVPLGLAAGLAAVDASNHRTGKVMDPNCVAAGGGSECATNALPMKIAPENGGTEGSRIGIALLALNFGGLAAGSTTKVAVSGVIKALDKIDYIAPPGAPSALQYDSFLTLPPTNQVTIAQTGHQLNLGPNSDPSVQIYRFEIVNHSRLGWNIWVSPVPAGSVPSAVTLPDPSQFSAGLVTPLIDPLADEHAADNTALHPTARLLGLKLAPAISAQKLETFGSPVTLDQIGPNLAAFTVVQATVAP